MVKCYTTMIFACNLTSHACIYATFNDAYIQKEQSKEKIRETICVVWTMHCCCVGACVKALHYMLSVIFPPSSALWNNPVCSGSFKFIHCQVFNPKFWGAVAEILSKSRIAVKRMEGKKKQWYNSRKNGCLEFIFHWGDNLVAIFPFSAHSCGFKL